MRSNIRIALTVLVMLAVCIGLVGAASAAYGTGIGGKGKSSFGGFSNFGSKGKTSNIKAFGTSDAFASNKFGSFATSDSLSKINNVGKKGYKANGYSPNGVDSVGFNNYGYNTYYGKGKSSDITAFGTSDAFASNKYGSFATSDSLSKIGGFGGYKGYGSYGTYGSFFGPKTSSIKAFGTSDAFASNIFGSFATSDSLSKIGGFGFSKQKAVL